MDNCVTKKRYGEKGNINVFKNMRFEKKVLVKVITE